MAVSSNNMSLNPLWFTQEPIDFEHKQYLLLAYLQEVEESLCANRMYPATQEVYSHINTITTFKSNRNAILERLRSIKNINPQTMEFEYTYPDISQEMCVLDEIIDFAEPRLRKYMTRLTESCIKVMSGMTWYPVGIIPTYTSEGFVTIITGPRQACYRYSIMNVIVQEENCVAVNMEFVTERASEIRQLDELKSELARTTDLPVPMMVAVETEPYPANETLVPIVKRLIPQKIREIAGTRNLP